MKRNTNRSINIFILIALILLPIIFNIQLVSKSEFDENGLSNPRLHTSTLTSNESLIFGTAAGPEYLDPIDVWDLASNNVLDQIAEPLLRYDLEDTNLSIIPCLATSKGIWSGPNYTISIREGVKFHDGTDLNAAAVQWTFDRIQYFMNTTGAIMDPDDLAFTTELYLWPNGTQVLNHTEIVDTYTVKFCLNYYYAVWEPLLCFTTSYIISPTAHKTDTRIDNDTPINYVVGTGPFKWVSHTPGEEVRMTRFDDYWAGPSAIKTLVFSILPDLTSRNLALLNESVDIIDGIDPEKYETYMIMSMASENVKLLESGQYSAQISYIGMNTRGINVTWREAISYSIYYDYIQDPILYSLQGYTERLKSIIPASIPYSNYSFNYPISNITHARKTLVDVGICSFDIYSNAEWYNAADNNPLATMNYSFHWLDDVQEQIGILLKDDLRRIGVNLTLVSMSFMEYYYTVLGKSPYDRNDLGLWTLYYLPTHADPSDYINNLFAISSQTDSTQLDDSLINQWMIDGLVESDPVKREAIYDKIQKRIVEDLMPYALTFVEKLAHAHDRYLKGFQQNSLNKYYFYPCYFEAQSSGSGPGIPGYDLLVLLMSGVLMSLVLYTTTIKKFKTK